MEETAYRYRVPANTLAVMDSQQGVILELGDDSLEIRQIVWNLKFEYICYKSAMVNLES
jgi:hypothetical protein